MSLEKLILKNRVLICVGSGGVGKTTLSASLAVKAAQMGRKVLVMTIDPSKRLRVALGFGGDSHEKTRVPGQNYPGELWALLLNAKEIFKEFILSSATRPDLAERLLKNRLYRQLSTTLSGSQEFTSLLQLSKIVSESQYDTIILDTPPSQHAVDFLEAPEKIGALFEDSVVRWFIGDEEAVGFFRKVISKGTRTVLSALERITGSVFMTELNDFFTSVRSVQSKIGQKTELVRKILFSDATGFVLVTGFDVGKLKEAEQMKSYLDAKGYHMVAIAINRAFPLWKTSSTGIVDQKVAQIYAEWANYHSARELIYRKFHDRWSKELPVLRIPDLNKDLNGLDGLEVMSNEVDSAFHSHARDSSLLKHP